MVRVAISAELAGLSFKQNPGNESKMPTLAVPPYLLSGLLLAELHEIVIVVTPMIEANDADNTRYRCLRPLKVFILYSVSLRRVP